MPAAGRRVRRCLMPARGFSMAISCWPSRFTPPHASRADAYRTRSERETYMFHAPGCSVCVLCVFLRPRDFSLTFLSRLCTRRRSPYLKTTPLLYPRPQLWPGGLREGNNQGRNIRHKYIFASYTTTTTSMCMPAYKVNRSAVYGSI